MLLLLLRFYCSCYLVSFECDIFFRFCFFLLVGYSKGLWTFICMLHPFVEHFRKTPYPRLDQCRVSYKKCDENVSKGRTNHCCFDSPDPRFLRPARPWKRKERNDRWSKQKVSTQTLRYSTCLGCNAEQKAQGLIRTVPVNHIISKGFSDESLLIRPLKPFCRFVISHTNYHSGREYWSFFVPEI